MSDFKSTLLTISDDAFFELIRNYLGPIKTPFNKHDLISRLIAFIHRDDTQDRIVSLIDESDGVILTAIWLLDEPSHEELFSFLSLDHGFLELHNHLLNLEDRLLVYRDSDRVKINPELHDRILDEIIHPSRLFKAPKGTSEQPGDAKVLDPGDLEPTGNQVVWVDDGLLAATFSYLLEEPEIYRADGSLRKRAAATLAERLPVLTERISRSGDREVLRVDFLIAALTGLGLLVEDGSRLRPVAHAWHRWSRLPALSRLAQLAGAGATLDSGEINDTIAAAEAVLMSLPEDLPLDPIGISRLAAAATGVPSESATRAVGALMRMGLLAAVEGKLERRWGTASSATTKPVVIQANFELTLPAEIEFPAGLFIAAVGELRRHDRYSRFELTKDRVASAMRDGLGGTHITEHLDELSDGALPQNVAISIKTWEEEYESIRLYRGVVLQVQESRIHAVLHAPSLSDLVVTELAPGTYLFDESDVPELQDALRDAGVELVPELPPPDPTGPAPWSEKRETPSDLGRIRRMAKIVADSASRTPVKLAGAAEVQRELEQALEKRSMPAEQREELAERIRRKLIVSEKQLKSGALKSEKTEAKGLDFSGKVRIVEQSIANGEYLEVIERLADGNPRRRLVEPESMRKSGTELILVGIELPGREPVELSVSKLGLVRRLRATLFKR